MVSLPNSLFGYVSLTRISTELTKEIENTIVKDDEEVNEDADLPSLEDLFTVGQWVRAAVVENTAINKSSDTAQRKHIQLSLEPEVVNSSVAIEDILPKTILQVSVSSIEDHGIIVSLGLSKLNGFIKKSLLGRQSYESIKVGQVFLACVVQRPKNRVVQLSLDLDTAQSPLADVSDIGSLLPGSLVQCLVTEIKAAGAGGKILGVLDGTIDKFHVGDAPIKDNTNVRCH